MEKVSLSNKVFTENPLLDEIIYNARQLATGTVLKDQDLADKNETLESITNSDIYIAIKRGLVKFDNFIYDEDFLEPYVEQSHLEAYTADNNLIPESLRPTLLNKASEKFMENYVELNNYYRMLHGDPSYDETGIWEGLWIDKNYISDVSSTSISNISNRKESDSYVLIHELSLAECNMLYSNGTVEAILEDEDQLTIWELTKDDVRYLNHIGDRVIDYYTARTADKFALLYCPPCDSDSLKRRYKDLIEANRLYLLYTSYSEAYKLRSDYYDNFMMIFIIIQTIIDMIVELPEYIIRRDIFDSRTCKYIFESNGVKYFKDIPLKYQVALVKNLNKLIKFKSTDKCIVDIASIFGIENIEVFRYYIMKDRQATRRIEFDESGNREVYYDYYNNTKVVYDEEGNSSIVPDNSSNYDLKFIKVPLIGNYDEYIRTDSNIYNYDSITDGDDYWIGDQDYKTIKNDIKDLDFTVLRSKYYSIEAVIDIAKRNFTLIYFINMLMYNNVDKSTLLVNLPNISTVKKFELVDIIIALYSLSYIYYGVEDTIIDSRSKAAQILGFNMEADLAKISSWLSENHYGLTLKDLHVDTFTVPDNDTILSFNELQSMYFANKDCYDHVKELLTNPPSKEIYDAYKYIYKSMFIMNKNMEYFIVDDDNGILTKYRDGLGYKVKFITIPDKSKYTNIDDYKRDYAWLMKSCDYETLYFVIPDDFNIEGSNYHKLQVYTKFNNVKLEYKGVVTMADTYRNFLRYKDPSLYSYLQGIVSIVNIDTRREACINAIQSITSYLKDYIDQDGDDAISLDTVFSGLPSISVDFIKKYITEVIDFFKSFKIFTHESSIIYLFRDKYENTVKLIEHILIKYLLDKSELIRIEDTLEGKALIFNGKLINAGSGIKSNLFKEEKYGLLDKVWFSIDTWVIKNYNEIYNSENYQETSNRIKDKLERFSTINNNDYMEILEDISAIILGLIYKDKVNINEHYHAEETREFEEYYNEWITDIFNAFDISIEVLSKMNYQDDITSSYYHDFEEVMNIIDGRNSMSFDIGFFDKYSLSDGYHGIITQEFPAHSFDE